MTTSVQAPIVISVVSSTVPIRVGMPVSSPYLITNTSAVSTVWVGPDSSLRSGTGMQIPPGGFLTRTVPGELWAILDSSATVSATVILDVTADNWGSNPSAIATAIVNSGVIIIDNPTLMAQVAGSGGAFNTGSIDVTKFQSIDIQYQPNGAGAATLTVSWQQNGVVIGQDLFGYASGDVNILKKKLACRGNQVTISGPNTGTTPFTVFGSSRPVTGYNTCDISNRMLCSVNTAGVASGGSVTATPSERYDGPIIITAIAFNAAAAAPHLLEGIDDVTGLGFGYDQPQGVLALAANRSVSTLHCVAPRNTWHAVLFNFAGTAQQLQIEVVAAPEGS